MTAFAPSLDHFTREDLLDRLARVERDNRELTASVTAVQTVCTQQLEELRHYRRSGLCLPGWWCSSCGGFNGAAKQVRLTCRACSAPKPGTETRS